MEIGTVGVPLGLAARQDFDAVFSQMKATGMTLFVLMSIFEEWPEPQGEDTGQHSSRHPREPPTTRATAP